MDVGQLRKMAAAELGKRALADLMGEEDTSLDDVFLDKAASAEDPQLFRIAMRMGGDPIGNYEALGGKYKAAAFYPEQEMHLIDAANVVHGGGMGALTGAGIGALGGAKHVLPGAGYGALAGAGLGLAMGPALRGLSRATGYKGPFTIPEEDAVLKEAFGQPMFQAASAPDPKVQAAGMSPTPSGSSGPKLPSPSSGPQGGGGTSSGMSGVTSMSPPTMSSGGSG